MIIAAFCLQGIALVGGTLHSQVPGQGPQVGTLVFEDQRIVGIHYGSELPQGENALPEDFEQIDITGLHVIPGLIDGMINHDAEHDVLYLASGVTYCRDTGNDLTTIVQQKQDWERARIPGPDLHICGQVFDGLSSGSHDALRLMNPESVPVVLDQIFKALAESGSTIDYASFVQTLPKETWLALLQEARNRQLPVWGPLPEGATLQEALQAGQAGFLGLQWILPAGMDWRELNEARVTENAIACRDALGAITPLMYTYGRMLSATTETETHADATAWLAPFYETQWHEERAAWKEALTPEKRAELESVMQTQGEWLLRLHEAGVPLVPGSAAPNPWIVPGQGLIDELEAWGRAGIARDQVIAYATREAARTLGVLNDRGTLEVGKLADMVVLGADPTQALSALRDPQMVLMRGRLFERKALLGKLDELKERQAQIRAELNRELDVPAPVSGPGDLVLQGQAETWSGNNRLCVEHFQVKRIGQDRWSYATRMVYPKTALNSAKEVQLYQVMDGNLVERFDMQVSAVGSGELQIEAIGQAPTQGKRDSEAPAPEETPADRNPGEKDPGPDPSGTPKSKTPNSKTGDLPQLAGLLHVRGRRVAGTKILNIEHRKDGFFLSSLRAQDPVGHLDVSLVLNALIVAKHAPAGGNYVVTFEGSALEPVTDRWTTSIRAADRLLQVQSSRGALAFGLDGKGQLHFAGRQRGTSQMHAYPKAEFKTFGGPGLALPPERVFELESIQPQEAGQKQATGAPK